MVGNGASFLRKLLLLLVLGFTLYASDSTLATKIYLSIAKEIAGKNVPTFYLHGNIKYLNKNKEIKALKACAKADIVILNELSGLPEECQGKLLFTTHYSTYIENKNILGAFFWQKGRPNIIFRRSLLEKNKVVLSSSFNKFIE